MPKHRVNSFKFGRKCWHNFIKRVSPPPMKEGEDGLRIIVLLRKLQDG